MLNTFSRFDIMGPLASLICVLCLCSKASCGYNETELGELRDLWFNAIKKSKSNESLLRRGLRDDDFQSLLLLLSDIKAPEDQQNIFEDIKTILLQNSLGKIFGFKIGLFTNYCGPGDVAGPLNETVTGLFNGVDECCKVHDHCDTVVSSKADFKQYPALPFRKLYFSSLSCKCDVNFYNCIKQTKSIFGELILGIYSTAQSSCFDYDYKIERCTKYDE